MIKRLFPDQVYNPIREHIQMSFSYVGDDTEMANQIAQELKGNSFEPSKSRVLIFAHTRKATETATELLKIALEDQGLPYSENVDFYHAGLDGITREEKYEDYKSGKIAILIATKAFGMGMDIRNIHFVYHLGPSSTFEDYLQEVGRAGRDNDSLIAAGYSKDNPVQSKCLLTKDDFRRLKDRFHSNQITWNQIDQVRLTIFNYYSKFRKLETEKEYPFPLPLDLLDQFVEYSDVYDRDTFFRVILYWLEKLKRIKLGVHTPTYLPIKILDGEFNFSHLKSAEERGKIKELHQFLIQYKKSYFPHSSLVMLDLAKLRDKLKLKSNTEIYRLLFQSQRAKVLVIERSIKLQPTNCRMEELKEWKFNAQSPRLEATFDFAMELLGLTKPGDQINLNNQELEQILQNQIFQHFQPRHIFWKEIKNEKKAEYYSSQEIALKLKEDFAKTRSKFAFKILKFLPKVRHNTILEIEKGYDRPFINQLIYNGYRDLQEPRNEIITFKEDLIKLIKATTKTYIEKNETEFNIVDLINELDLTDKTEEYFQNLIFISKGLGYLKGYGKLIPMGVEMRILNVSELEDNTIGKPDYVIKQEFIESNGMKELRLLALECLSEIDRLEQDEYIKRYFKCGGQGDLISLLEEYIGEDHSQFQAFRQEALSKEKERLNSSQEILYSADIRRSLQVIAGPGSGKTHTLTLRVARLIQEEKVNPRNILILAYNRSVVVELKERLRNLFKALGYSKLITQLNVFTFHGLIKYCISDQIKDLSFEEWTPKFLHIMERTPGLIAQRLGQVKYVFVDEFQDITAERMLLLKHIATPKRVRVCVIGDPNQSIYGYQRAEVGDSMNPQPFYEQFKEIYNPLVRELDTNYRSYLEIIEAAEQLLSLNQSKFDLKDLKAFRKPPIEHEYCSIHDYHTEHTKWEEKLRELLSFELNGSKYAQIAVMFRSNNEVFRAFNRIKELNIDNVRIRIQGSKGDLFKSREFYHLTSILQEKADEIISDNFLNEIKSEKEKVMSHFKNWDHYLLNIFHCLAIEFEKEKDNESTYLDFILFVKDLSSNDDGQYGKIYQQNIHKINAGYQDQEIVLTTMHKVKGLEFDAVLIPPSFSNLPAFENNAPLQEVIEEERRLYYVAYTRAKFRLVVIKYDRENALDKGEQYAIPNNLERKLGIPVKEGLDKFKMYWSAGSYGGNSFEFLRTKVSIGDPIKLIKEHRGGFSFWHVYIHNVKIAQLSRQMSDYIDDYHQVTNFSVSSIYVHTYQETLASDERNGTQYSQNWTNSAKERSFIYLIDFSGYGNAS